MPHLYFHPPHWERHASQVEKQHYKMSSLHTLKLTVSNLLGNIRVLWFKLISLVTYSILQLSVLTFWTESKTTYIPIPNVWMVQEKKSRFSLGHALPCSRLLPNRLVNDWSIHTVVVCSLSTDILEAGIVRRYNNLNEWSKVGLSKMFLLPYFWNSLLL